MKRFALKMTLTIVLPVLLFFGSYELIMRQRPDRWKYKSEICRTTDLSKVEVLVLGNSHTLEAFWPRYFGVPTLNLAQTSQSYNYDCLLLEKYLPAMDSLHYVIIDLSHSSPWETLEESTSAWLCKRYAVHFGLRNHHWWEYRYRYYFSEVSPALLMALLSPPEDNPYDPQGFPTNLERCDDIEADAAETVRRHAVDTLRHDIYNDNLSMLENMAVQCAERGIEVVFVSTPMHPAYRKLTDPRRLALAAEFADTLCRHHNVRWLDYYDDCRFVDSDFVNSDHLAACGAAKLTAIVADTLKIKANKRNED